MKKLLLMMLMLLPLIAGAQTTVTVKEGTAIGSNVYDLGSEITAEEKTSLVEAIMYERIAEGSDERFSDYFDLSIEGVITTKAALDYKTLYPNNEFVVNFAAYSTKSDDRTSP